jgi:hypothetical protein
VPAAGGALDEAGEEPGRQSPAVRVRPDLDGAHDEGVGGGARVEVGECPPERVRVAGGQVGDGAGPAQRHRPAQRDQVLARGAGPGHERQLVVAEHVPHPGQVALGLGVGPGERRPAAVEHPVDLLGGVRPGPQALDGQVPGAGHRPIVAARWPGHPATGARPQG